MNVASLVRWWGPLVAYMLAMFWASSGARPQVLGGAPDEILHAAEFFVLGLLCVRAFARGLDKPASSRAFWSGLVLAFAYGVSDEWHQSFVSSRVASLGDVAADGVGVLLAGAFLRSSYGVSDSGSVAPIEPRTERRS